MAMLAVSCNKDTSNLNQSQNNNSSAIGQQNNETKTEPESNNQTIEFSKLSSTYKFSGSIPDYWKAEYVSSIESINIYDTAKPGNSNIEKSVIFIRNFNANSFLTLQTVDILSRADANINGHAAVRYEIKNKPGVANFPNQPLWRNGQHKLIDIRYSQTNPSPFFVFAYNPDLPSAEFETFITSLKFHNDSSSLQYPINDAVKRVTKKPFGIKVSQTNSPVIPERFNGFHNAVDFEILNGEELTAVKISSICGGTLLNKQQVNGYGGLATQSCLINDELVTVLYGHLDLSSISPNANDYLAPGDFVGYLGTANSQETDGERKHLHLGIKKGQSSDIRGYVATSSELSEWLDFLKLIS